MATALQSETSRANGALSTGPITPQGKARSAQNALKHGLYAKGRVLPWESQEDYDQLREDLHNHYQVPEIHRCLVDQLASELWHIQRAERSEEALLIDNRNEARANLIRHGTKNPTEDQILANTYIRLNTCSSYLTALRERDRSHRHARLLRAELARLMRPQPQPKPAPARPRPGSFPHPDPGSFPTRPVPPSLRGLFALIDSPEPTCEPAHEPTKE
ncbi:MAG: hypothetical protein FJW40_05685 [Acidobacteria bacterium]|nr:hypothetical protein [Acidobacteriota bacterium]